MFEINANLASLNNVGTADGEETVEHSFSGNVPAASSHESLLSTVWHDTQEFPTPSAQASDLLSEQKQDLDSEENKVRLRLLQSELDQVRRDIDAKFSRQVELENLIALTHLFSDSVLMDDGGGQYYPESRDCVTNTDVLSSTSNCLNSVLYMGCESKLPGLLDDRLPPANAISVETTRSNTQTEEIDSDWLFVPPSADETKAQRTSLMPITESSETTQDCNIQSNEIRMGESHDETPSKRVRFTTSKTFEGVPPSSCIPTAFILDSEAAFTQAWHHPSTFKDRNRLSRVLLGQLSALQVSSGESSGQDDNKVPEGSDRPASYPRTQRWRKSIGVSVKALREGFERLSLLGREKRDSQTQSMLRF